MPVRSIPRNYRSLTGRLNNTRHQGSVAFESTLERDFYLLLDFDVTVTSFEEQPVQIKFVDSANTSRTYTPDVLVYYRGDLLSAEAPLPTLYEVKYRDDLRAHWSEYRAKFKAAKRYARQQGWCFRLITEREIRTPLLKNVKFLREYRRRVFDQADRLRLLTVLEEQGTTEVENLLLRLNPTHAMQAQLLPLLWHLVAVRKIAVDLSAPLTMRSRLWLPGSTQAYSDD